MQTLPIHYFGNKSKAAPQIWSLLGDVPKYIEPFCGSCAVLFSRPHDYTRRVEMVNDIDGYLVNMLRTIKYAPEKLAEEVKNTICSNLDIKARINDAQKNDESMRDFLGESEKNFDITAAAGYYTSVLDTIGASSGVIEASKNHHRLSVRGKYETLFSQVSQRLKYVTIHSTSWEKTITPAQLGILTGIYLDPPYAGVEKVYSHSTPVSQAVEEWCIVHTGERHRIVLSGYDDEHDKLLDYGWGKQKTVKSSNGAGALGNNTNTEMLWYSPTCIAPTSDTLF